MEVYCPKCGAPVDVAELYGEGMTPSQFARRGCEALGFQHEAVVDEELAEASAVLCNTFSGLNEVSDFVEALR